MAYGDFKDLARRIAFDKVIRNDAFKSKICRMSKRSYFYGL